MDELRPGYYAIIPADVRYDDKIPANAKLLYGEISALIGRDGFCFASNQYFADIYQIRVETVARLVTKLEKAGYIIRELERDATGQVVRRKLYLSVSVPDIQPLDKKVNTPCEKNQEGIGKNVKYTNPSITSICKENKQRKPKGEKRLSLTDEDLQKLFVQWIAGTASEDWDRKVKNQLYFALISFYAPRERKKQEPARTEAGFTALSNRLLRLSDGDPQQMLDMLERATTSNWKSVWPPEGNGNSSRASAPDDDGRYGPWL